jgi:hypothetical protein
MPNFKYKVEVLELKEIHEMPNAWTNEDFKNLLVHIEYDDVASIPDDELKDMTCLALSDFEVDEAAIKVLEYRLGDTLNKGQQKNLAEELKEDRLWEEYSNIKLHEELFNIGCILYWTFPKKFSTPDIVNLKVKITALNQESSINIKAPNESFLARILNDGMDSSNIMSRLFNSSIKSDSFPEAEHIIWQYESIDFSPQDNANTISIYTSWNWINKLRGVEMYESAAFSDGQL